MLIRATDVDGDEWSGRRRHRLTGAVMNVPLYAAGEQCTRRWVAIATLFTRETTTTKKKIITIITDVEKYKTGPKKNVGTNTGAGRGDVCKKKRDARKRRCRKRRETR